MSERSTTGMTRDELQGARCDNPLIPCTECGREDRFIAMKRAEDWELEYVDGGPEWVAYCPECSESSAHDTTGSEQSEGEI